ncbi:hypothetical protein ACHAQH_001465 [Verticillium albo-atrum]
MRNFYVHLLEIPEQDMQTVSWQDIVVRIMALRDANPNTALNMTRTQRDWIRAHSKERLDAVDIASRLMRKDNYLIAMINKDVLDITLPIPFMRRRQFFSGTLQWWLYFSVIDLIFDQSGQVNQEFLKSDRRGLLSRKLHDRFVCAGLLNLLCTPFWIGYQTVIHLLNYYNEYKKNSATLNDRRYTALARWKFREFNELPHLFQERINMSYPFASRYIDQFPKRLVEQVARSVTFMSGAITFTLAAASFLDPESFLGFEITKDRTALFYIGVFGSIWALARGMISEETTVFDPEFALKGVLDFTHHMPDHWHGRLHSFDVKQEFSELYKLKIVILAEEILGIFLASFVLIFSAPKSSDQIIDFVREFTIHVDGLGYVCSFAEFDFRKGVGNQKQPQGVDDVREDYYMTKHGKMAASYYGFLENYVINPKTGMPGGHVPPSMRQQFQPPPAFPGLNSPNLVADVRPYNTSNLDIYLHRTLPHPLQAVTLAALQPKPFGEASEAAAAMAQPTAELVEEEYDYESLPPNFSLLQNMAAGAFAGIAEHTVMYPIDAIKTRMQVLNPTASTAYNGVIQGTYKMATGEGFLSLWRGMSSVVAGAGPAHAVYFATYEAVKHVMGGNQAGVHHPLAAATSGACATIASDALMNPFDVIKQRMQMQNSAKMYRSMTDCARYVYKSEGLSAFYVSYPTTLSMTVPFTALQFLAYESISTTMNPAKTYDPTTHCVAGGVAGGFAAALTTPMDVIKTMLQTRGTATDPELRTVNGFMAGCRLLMRREGTRGFFKGIGPRVVTTMPSTAICWSAYEASKYVHLHFDR